MRSRQLHFIGICGKGMGAIAHALSREGWRVTGSDEGAYSPMSEFLHERGIGVTMPYDPANIPEGADLVVVGKRVREDNPELRHAIARGLPYCSFPALLSELFLDRSQNAVIAGGVGKTTTTAMLAWILEDAGRRPNYLIGGLARNFEAPARLAAADLAVLEGDEYASSFDDSRAKFLHYRPQVVVITNVVEDHPDLYSDIGAVEDAFAELVSFIPRDGFLVIPDDDESALRVAAGHDCEAVRVGFSARADQRITHLDLSACASRFRLGGADFVLSLHGNMNVRNAAMAAVAASHFDVTFAQSAQAMARFAGVTNRQQASTVGPYTVVTDKASHPFALAALFEAVRQRFPRRRVVSLIQPRATGGKDWVYQRDLPEALAGADGVVAIDAYEHNPEPGRSWKGGRFSIDTLIAALAAREVPAVHVPNAGMLPAALRNFLRQDDVIVLSLPEQATQVLGIVEETLRGG